MAPGGPSSRNGADAGSLPSFLIPQEAAHVVTVVFGKRRRQEIQRVTVAADNAAFAGQFRLVHGFRDVAVEELEKGLRALPGVAIERVSLEATRHHGPSWLITFAEAAGSLQTLQAPSVFSFGSGRVTVEEVKDGEHAVGGVFTLRFLDLGTTVPVAVDASAGTLEEFLRDMSGLDVTVDRTDLSDRRGFQWEVTFRPVGPGDGLMDLVTFDGNMPLLEIETSGLFGGDIDGNVAEAQVGVRSLLGRGAAVVVEEVIASTTVAEVQSIQTLVQGIS